MTPRESASFSVDDGRARLEKTLADNESLRRLAASVAHDFNNLLAVITGYSELLLRRLRPNDPLRSSAESIKKATEWGTALAQQILTASGVQGQPRATVNEVVANVAKVLQPAVGDRIELITRLDRDAGCVALAPGTLGQALMNLVVNARDAMPGGGRLTIATAGAGSETVLSVTDTGVGMDAATQGRLFEPYFTTKEPGRGTGLGLSTAWDVITRAGGRIEVSSEVGQGSTFAVYLPRAGDPAESARRPESGASATKSRVVLVVEDETPVRELIRDVLRLEGYTVLEACDAETALAIAERHAGPIDLLIMDLNLPGVPGDELAVKVATARPGIKVVYVSGYLEPDEPSRRLGPLLQKPFTIAALTETVRSVLGPTGSAGT